METFCAHLWMILNRNFATEEQVLIRRKLCELFESPLSDNDDLGLVVISGSKAEGTFIEGSDIDIMCVLKVSDHEDLQNNFIIETENIKPGFVRIRLGTETIQDELFILLFVETNDGFFLSSLFFRDVLVDESKDMDLRVVPHGPCVSIKDLDSHDTEVDVLGCFKCSTWPALEWAHRTRNQGWPSQVLVQNIIEEGCLLVPIGNPCSSQAFIEWRISFSLAEKRLVHSFNHTQLLCYGLLKLYLKQVINSNAEVRDLLCSYFLKTSMFYCIEEENISWCKENILDCFRTCFRRLLKWVQQGYCPNYFIKENNMFEGKIYGDIQGSLLRYLSQLDAEGDESLRKIKCLFGSDSGNCQGDIARAVEIKEKEYLCDHELCFEIGSDLLSNVTKLETLLKIKSEEACSVDTAILQSWYNCVMIFQIQQVYKDTLEELPNKIRYKKIKGLKRYIKQKCVNIDKCTRMLILATLYYLNGEYKYVILVVEEVLKTYGRFMTMLCNRQIYMDEICGRGFTLQQKIDLGLFSNLFFFKKDCGFYPQEIESELLSWSDKDHINVPAVPYSNILLVLSYYHLKQTQRMFIALNKLDLAVHMEQESDIYRSMAISLLQKCTEVIELHYENS